MTDIPKPSIGDTSWDDWAAEQEELSDLARSSVQVTGDQTIAGSKTFTTGVKTTRLAVGNHILTDARQPAGINVVLDGSTLPSTPLTNKTGAVTAVTFSGGFTAEAGYGVADPGHLFGANDYIITGTTSGDMAGATDMWGRLSEVHVRAPGTSLAQLYGFSGQAAIESTATATTVTWMASVYAPGPRNSASATVTNAASVYTLSPNAGTATNQYNIYAGGTAANFFGGKITANDGISVAGGASAFHVTTSVTTPNTQTATFGVYLGKSGSDPAIELANGTNNWRLDNASGILRFLRAGVASRWELDGVGNVKMPNSGTPPTSGGNYLYAEGGALKWRGSSGTVTTIAPA